MEQYGHVRFLSTEDVIRVGGGDIGAAMKGCEDAFRLWSERNAQELSPPPITWDEGGSWRAAVHGGYVGGDVDAVGVKWIIGNPRNTAGGKIPRSTGLILLNDRYTGLPLCIMEGTLISATRTGAVGGIGAKYLARSGAEVATAIGCGPIGRVQMEAIQLALRLKELRIYDLDRERARAFARFAEGELRFERTYICGSVEEAVQGSDVIACATVTGSGDSYLEGEWLEEGSLLINTSANDALPSAIELADLLVLTDYGHLSWRGSLHRANVRGDLKGRDMCEIGEIIAEKRRGRTSESQRIFFDAGGMGINDVVNAQRVYEAAVASGVGVELRLWEHAPLVGAV